MKLPKVLRRMIVNYRTKKLLERYGIDYQKWGTTGESRHVSFLAEEILEGEAYLEEVDGRILRKSYGVVAEVYYRDGTDLLYLEEDRQVYAPVGFQPSRTRRRADKIRHSIGEKCKIGEFPQNALIRGFREELGITPPFIQFVFLGGETRGVVPSVAFPGILTQYHSDRYRVFLTAEQFNPDGYIERQPDKTSYFVWKKVDGMLAC